MSKSNYYVIAPAPSAGYIASLSSVQGSNTSLATSGATGIISLGSSVSTYKLAASMDLNHLKRLRLPGPIVAGNTVTLISNTTSSNTTSIASPNTSLAGPGYTATYPTISFIYGQSGFDGLNSHPGLKVNKNTQQTVVNNIFQDNSVNAADAGETS